MKLVLTGCEYAGVTTLMKSIAQWGKTVMGVELGDGHNHFKVPHLSHQPDLTDEEQANILAMSPRVKEIFQRYNIEYHLQPGLVQAPNHIVIGMHIDEAVYAPLYYGYGEPGAYAERVAFARHTEERLLELAPGFVHVLVKASPEVIARRMKEAPHQNAVLREKDIDFVLREFEKEYERTLIKNKFAIDTSTATAEESFAEFLQKYEPFFSDSDRITILTNKARERGEWL